MPATPTMLQDIQGLTFNGAAITLAADLDLALWDGDPGPTGATGTEITGANGLTRQSLTRGTTDWTAATLGATSTVSNANLVAFGTATTNLTADYGAVFSGTTLIWSGTLTSALTITSGNPVEIAAGQASFTLTGMVNAYNQDVMGLVYNAQAITLAADLDVALYSVAPGADGTGGTEQTGSNGITRQSLTRGTTDWSAATLATPSVVDNANLVDFGTATGAIPTLVAFQVFSGANPIWNGALTTNRTPATNDPVEAAAGALTFNLQ